MSKRGPVANRPAYGERALLLRHSGFGHSSLIRISGFGFRASGFGIRYCPARLYSAVDLASGCPFWPLNDGILHAYPSLSEDVSCQVAIVGAGVTGALAAYYLSKEGVDVVVVDKRDVGTGSTGACTGLLQYELDVPLYEL